MSVTQFIFDCTGLSNAVYAAYEFIYGSAPRIYFPSSDPKQYQLRYFAIMGLNINPIGTAIIYVILQPGAYEHIKYRIWGVDKYNDTADVTASGLERVQNLGKRQFHFFEMMLQWK